MGQMYKEIAEMQIFLFLHAFSMREEPGVKPLINFFIRFVEDETLY